MQKYYYFYDLYEVLIDRYPAKIASLISSATGKNNFVFIYSKKSGESGPQNIPEGSMAFYIGDLNRIKLDQLVLEYPPNSLTTIAQRIPDMWMLSYFNALGHPTYLVQHGLFSDRLQRIPLVSLLLSRFTQFIHYVKHVHSICKLNNLPMFLLLVDLYRFLLKANVNIPDTKYLSHDGLRARKAFVFDESWNEFYVKKYGYKEEDLIYIGNPDFMQLRNKDISDKEDAVCYLCQSLVEDGRYSLGEYKKFLNLLNCMVATNKKLYIKLHPRSERGIYDVFNGNGNVIITNELPICKFYIGHYTGLLATAKHISDDILIWKLPHHHIPEYFHQFGSVVTSKKSDLKKFIFGNMPHGDKINGKTDATDTFMQIDPLETIARELLTLSS